MGRIVSAVALVTWKVGLFTSGETGCEAVVLLTGYLAWFGRKIFDSVLCSKTCADVIWLPSATRLSDVLIHTF